MFVDKFKELQGLDPSDDELTLHELIDVETAHYALAVPRLLRRARDEAGLTQNDVAAKLGRHQSWVSKMEQRAGSVTVSQLVEYLRGVNLRLVIGAADSEGTVRNASYRLGEAYFRLATCSPQAVAAREVTSSISTPKEWPADRIEPSKKEEGLLYHGKTRKVESGYARV